MYLVLLFAMSKINKEKLIVQTIDRIWDQLNSKLDGKFRYAPSNPKDFSAKVVEGQWELRLATILEDASFLSHVRGSIGGSSQTFLSILNKELEDFEFLVRTENFWDIAKKKLFKFSEVQIGPSDFDDRFLFSTNDDIKLRALFSDLQIQEGMLSEKIFILVFDKGELTYTTGYPIHNMEYLKRLYRWMGRIMLSICLLDSEYQHDKSK